MGTPAPTRFVDYYQLLGLPITASGDQIDEAIKERRRKARRQAANNAVLALRQEAETLMSALAEAERTLQDPAARAAYDRDYAGRRAAAEASDTAQTADEGTLLEEIHSALARADYRTAGTLTAKATQTLNSAEAWDLHAQVLEAVSQYRPAADAARNAISRDPGNPEYHYRLGLSLEAADEDRGALEAYSAVHRLSSGDPLGQVAIARMMLKLDQIDEGLKILEPLHRQHPDNQLVCELYALMLGVSAGNVPAERARDGVYITSKHEVEEMRRLLEKALSLRFSDRELRQDLQKALDEVDDHARPRLTFWVWPKSLRVTLFWWIWPPFLTLIGLSALGSEPFWLLFALPFDAFLVWRAWAPLWRHQQRRQGVRDQERMRQTIAADLMRQMGRL